jgi:hypothetical protein
MDKRLSRPARWSAAVARGDAALREFNAIRAELRFLCEDMEDRWSEARADLSDAIADLSVIQNEYATMDTPDNGLAETRFHQKRMDVEGINIDGMDANIPDLREIIKFLEKLDLYQDIDFRGLDEARLVSLPLGYGRD